MLDITNSEKGSKPGYFFFSNIEVLGFLEKSLELEEKTNSKSGETFSRKTLSLSDGEKTIDVNVIGEPEKVK